MSQGSDPFGCDYDFEREAYMDSEADSLNDAAAVESDIQGAVDTAEELMSRMVGIDLDTEMGKMLLRNVLIQAGLAGELRQVKKDYERAKFAAELNRDTIKGMV